MGIIALMLLLIGIVFILMGYIDLFYKEKTVEEKVQYRFVPRNVYDNIASNDLDEQFGFMFDTTDVRFNTNLV